MRNGFARCLVLAGLATPTLFACGEDKPDDTGTTAGSSSGGSSAGTQSGGSATAGTNASAGTATGGTTGTAGTGTAGTGTAGTGTAGTGTAGAGTAGTGTAGTATGGSGGASGGSGGGGGGAASGTAVATIMGLNGQTVTGTATFTQGATMTKLVLNLTACPNGAHSSHLHVMKDCGNNGNLAGGHWTPNGEMLGEYSCTNNMVTHEVSKPITTWTVGDGGATDVTKYAFMVHAMSDAELSGARIGCGLINKQ